MATHKSKRPIPSTIVHTNGLHKKLLNAMDGNNYKYVDIAHVEQRAFIQVNYLRALVEAMAKQVGENPKAACAVQFILQVDLRNDHERDGHKECFTFRSCDFSFEKVCAKNMIQGVLQ